MKKILFTSAFILTLGAGFLFNARDVGSPLATAPITIEVAEVVTPPVVTPSVAATPAAPITNTVVIEEVAAAYSDQTAMAYLAEICSTAGVNMCFDKMSIAYYSRAFLYTEANYIIVSDRLLTFLIANPDIFLFKLMEETSRIIASL